MQPYQVQADETRLYSVVHDFTSVYRALITGAVSDEILGDFIAPDFTVTVTRKDLCCKATPEGLFAVTGYVEQSFPSLNSLAYSVDLILKATGFRDYAVTIPIPQNSVFPVRAPAIAMRRQPVRVQGRVVADTAQRLPVAGAQVITVDPSSLPPDHILALRSPLYFDHSSGATVEEVSMTSFSSAQLTADPPAGTQTLNLSNRATLAVGSIVRLSNVSGTLVEYCVVASPGTAAGAGPVFLRNALNRSYRSGPASTVDFVNASTPTVSATLMADANAGDGVLVASQLITASTVAIEPGSPDAEYHEIGAVTDADGYYFMDGIGRTPAVFLQASSAGFTDLIQDWVLEYEQPVNVVDFRIHQ